MVGFTLDKLFISALIGKKIRTKSLNFPHYLSKPEKDPRDIAKAGKEAKYGYPSCLLCMENEGYAGHFSHPARQNHRLIPISWMGRVKYMKEKTKLLASCGAIVLVVAGICLGVFNLNHSGSIQADGVVEEKNVELPTTTMCNMTIENADNK